MDNRYKVTGREGANSLVAAYGRHIGAGVRVLDQGDDVSFGDIGFHYDGGTKTLRTRVFIMRAHLTDWGPKAAENNRRVAQALNDPKIGGMYERGGGHFVLDEKKEMFFLVKDLPVNTNTRAFIDEVDELQNIGAVWVMHWVAHVADQALGQEPPPLHPVTRQNDPYK